jgi:hypothetical protein
MNKPVAFILILFLLSPMTSLSQTYGLRAGVNLSTYYDKEAPEQLDYSYIPGFHIGGIYDTALTKNLFLSIGIYFIQKGYKADYTYFLYVNPITGDIRPYPEGYEKYRIKLFYYLEVPILLKREFLINKTPLFLAVGPYFGIGLFGRSAWKTYKDDELIEKEWYKGGFGSGYQEQSRLNFGIQFESAVQLRQWEIGISYNHGLTSYFHEESSVYEISDRVFSIFLIYSFPTKKKQ